MFLHLANFVSSVIWDYTFIILTKTTEKTYMIRGDNCKAVYNSHDSASRYFRINFEPALQHKNSILYCAFSFFFFLFDEEEDYSH